LICDINTGLLCLEVNPDFCRGFLWFLTRLLEVVMKERFKAFILHLLLSLMVAIGVLFWVFNVWYPVPLHRALAVTHIFLLLIIVDMVLGPILTLLVYKPRKKTLVLDLVVIAALQLSAMIYGLWSVAQGRPAWLVFNGDRFDVVQVVDIDPRHRAQAAPEYQAPSWFGPGWVGADFLASGKYRNEILFEAAFGGPDIAQRPFLYRPLAEFAEDIQSRAQPLERLADYNDAETVATTLAKWPQASGWVPLMARAQPMVVLLKDDNTDVLGIVALNPWP